MSVQRGLAVVAALMLALVGWRVSTWRADGGGDVWPASSGAAWGLDPAELEPLTMLPLVGVDESSSKALDRTDSGPVWRELPTRALRTPVFLTHVPEWPGSLLVSELKGQLKLLPRDGGEARTLLDLADLPPDLRPLSGDGERSFELLGTAVDPHGPWLYLRWVDGRRGVIARVRRASEGGQPSIDASSARLVLSFKREHRRHNGGMLAFGRDGMLYASTGDSVTSTNRFSVAQQLGDLRGKVLRIDVRQQPYAIPADNPFVGREGARGEIWARGFRQPWRFSFDAKGRLWLGDVGSSRAEEVNLVVRGGNYGWNHREGLQEAKRPLSGADAALRDPALAFRHTDRAVRAVIGGYVYDGPSAPALRGHYIFGDNRSGTILASRPTATGLSPPLASGAVYSLTSFGVDGAGDLYALSFDGKVYRLETEERPASLPARLSMTGVAQPSAEAAGVEPARWLTPYQVVAPFWSDGASKRRWIGLPTGTQITRGDDGGWRYPRGTVLVKHFDLDGRRLETRVLVNTAAGWNGASYRWQGSEALRVDRRQQILGGAYELPAPQDCTRCHGADGVLGATELQLDREVELRDGRRTSQLALWVERGLLQPGAPPKRSMVNPADPGHSLDDRARSYLHANCASCHQPGGAGKGLDLRFTTLIGDSGMLTRLSKPGRPPKPPKPGKNHRRISKRPQGIVVPGAHTVSELWIRLVRDDKKRMPPIGRRLHAPGAELIREWIEEAAWTSR